MKIPKTRTGIVKQIENRHEKIKEWNGDITKIWERNGNSAAWNDGDYSALSFYDNREVENREFWIERAEGHLKELNAALDVIDAAASIPGLVPT